MQTKPKTVADLESQTGKPDSIRNADGKNARSDKKLTTLKKQYAKLIDTLEMPDRMPTAFSVHYGAEVVTIDVKKTAQLAAFAKLIQAIA